MYSTSFHNHLLIKQHAIFQSISSILSTNKHTFGTLMTIGLLMKGFLTLEVTWSWMPTKSIEVILNSFMPVKTVTSTRWFNYALYNLLISMCQRNSVSMCMYVCVYLCVYIKTMSTALEKFSKRKFILKCY